MLLKLIPWSDLKLIAIVTFTVSIAISTTGLYVLSISKSLSNSLAITEDELVIYSSTSKTPHTGMITDLGNYLIGIEGLESVSPEVLTPTAIGSVVVFLRGVNLTLFKDLGIIKSLNGSWPNSGSEVLVGSKLSNHLGISVGDSVVITGIPTGKEVKVVVKAVYTSEISLDDELLGDLKLARELRGIQGNYVTLIRVRTNKSLTNNLLLPKVLGTESKTASSLSNILSSLRVAQGSSELIDEVLGRGVKISSNFLWSSTLLVTISSVLTIYYGVSWVLNSLSHLLNSLRFVGLSRSRLAVVLIVKSSVISIASGFLGYIISYLLLNTLFEVLNPRILLHSVELVGDYYVLLISTLAPTSITLTSTVFKVREF